LQFIALIIYYNTAGNLAKITQQVKTFVTQILQECIKQTSLMFGCIKANNGITRGNTLLW